MPQSHDADFDQTVLDMIEHSPTGSVPRTPIYDDAIKRLHASQQVYHSADHKDGHVTARSLGLLPRFFASNLENCVNSSNTPELETNNAIFHRYLQSLPAALRSRAESYRLKVTGRLIHHRAKSGIEIAHDPLHTIFLIPGSGPLPGLPGNYLYGELSEKQDAAQASKWCLTITDTENIASMPEVATLKEAYEKFREVIESIPFHLTELEALGFTLV